MVKIGPEPNMVDNDNDNTSFSACNTLETLEIPRTTENPVVLDSTLNILDTSETNNEVISNLEHGGGVVSPTKLDTKIDDTNIPIPRDLNDGNDTFETNNEVTTSPTKLDTKDEAETIDQELQPTSTLLASPAPPIKHESDDFHVSNVITPSLVAAYRSLLLSKRLSSNTKRLSSNTKRPSSITIDIESYNPKLQRSFALALALNIDPTMLNSKDIITSPDSDINCKMLIQEFNDEELPPIYQQFTQHISKQRSETSSKVRSAKDRVERSAVSKFANV